MALHGLSFERQAQDRPKFAWEFPDEPSTAQTIPTK
jgi:hypothetical protein